MTKKKDQDDQPESIPEIIATGEDSGEDDEPELGISVGVENARVIIVFSQRLTTVGMPPDAADKMADALHKHAEEARRMTN